MNMETIYLVRLVLADSEKANSGSPCRKAIILRVLEHLTKVS